MPEGPEIKRIADRLADTLSGQRLDSVEFGLRRLKRHENLLVGSRVDAVRAHGKALLTDFDNGQSMYSHNQLYGVWRVVRRGRLPRTNRSLRVALHTASHSALLYSASEIEILETQFAYEHPFLRRLGPDVLSEEITWRDVAGRLLEAPFRGRSLAALYLDQHCLAGLGNYLRSEILFDAALAPDDRPAALSRGELGRLARSTLTITRRAYETGGVTNPPRRARALKRKIEAVSPEGERTPADSRANYEWYRFAAFNREDMPCYRCGDRIRRITAGSRRLYLCPTCQPARGRS